MMGFMQPRSRTEAGFTLAELAIVVLIVGLLIAGVLKGAQLVTNARMQRTVADLIQFSTAYGKFLDQYHAMPGDMIDATTRIAGCDATSSCVNGDGNRVVGVTITAWGGPDDTTIADENSQFWKHLALAGFINGLNPNASGTAAFGYSSPEAPLKGGYYVSDINQPAGGAGQGLQIRIQSIPSNAYNGGDEALTPHQSFWIDTKLDDGIATTGVVRTFNGADCVGYNETVSAAECVTGVIIPLKH